MAKPGALRAIREAEGRGTQPFDADKRTQERENAPVTVAGVTFRRRRKDWATSRAMRQAMRAQEKAHALHVRLRTRIAELEVEQIEAASKGNDERELELEGQIDALLERSDEATEEAELVTYRLLALLLVPPVDGDGAPTLQGWGPVDDPGEADPAVAFLQPALDVEDAAQLARELSGSEEPDPPETPSSETGSS